MTALIAKPMALLLQRTGDADRRFRRGFPPPAQPFVLTGVPSGAACSNGSGSSKIS
jgi:hypothetical protein